MAAERVKEGRMRRGVLLFVLGVGLFVGAEFWREMEDVLCGGGGREGGLAG